MKKQLPFLQVFLISICLSFFTVCLLYAQNFMYESNKFSVQQNGYHKIELNEQIINRLNASLNNIKLYDQDNKEIKYYLQGAVPLNPSVKRHVFPFYRKDAKPNISTSVVVENKLRESIDYFVLHCKPFTHSKTIKISGSPDHEQWFSLVDNYQISYTNNMPIDITVVKRSEFHYYKVEIDDFDSEPIVITKVEAETSLFPKDNYIGLQEPKITQETILVEKDSVTYIDFSFSERQYINWLDFQYVANVPIYALNVELQSKKDSLAFYEHIESFQLASGKPNYLIISKLYGQYFRLKIHHYTNQRLKFSNITVFQLKYNLLANMEKSKSYQLRFGGEHHISLPSAETSMMSIADSSLEIIYPATISKINSDKNAAIFIGENLSISWSLWSVIALTLIVVMGGIWFFIKKRVHSLEK
jgi:hypothetical protein